MAVATTTPEASAMSAWRRCCSRSAANPPAMRREERQEDGGMHQSCLPAGGAEPEELEPVGVDAVAGLSPDRLRDALEPGSATPVERPHDEQTTWW